MGFEPRALFALVAGDEFASVRKSDDVDVAMGGTALADVALGRVCKVSEFRFGDEGALAADVLLGVQRRAERAHQTRDAGADDLLARFDFE